VEKLRALIKKVAENIQTSKELHEEKQRVDNTLKKKGSPMIGNHFLIEELVDLRKERVNLSYKLENESEKLSEIIDQTHDYGKTMYCDICKDMASIIRGNENILSPQDFTQMKKRFNESISDLVNEAKLDHRNYEELVFFKNYLES
jgi:hypothetical protein